MTNVGIEMRADALLNNADGFIKAKSLFVNAFFKKVRVKGCLDLIKSHDLKSSA